MMPIYEFQCLTERCGITFESMMMPYDPVECPECKRKNVKKLITAHGGYKIKGNNGSSQRPSQAGSFKKKK